MAITTGDIQRNCYDSINFTPNQVALMGVGGNIKQFDPYDQVRHQVGQRIVLGSANNPGPTSNIYPISFARVAGGDSYYLPFQSDGITAVSLPANPGVGEPKYFFTIRLTACAIFIDSYQPTIAAGYLTPLGAQDTRPRLIISHANAVNEYQQAVTAGGINVGQNPAYFPMTAATQLDAYHNTMKGTYQGVVLNRRVLLKSTYNSAVQVELNRLIAQGNTNVQYGATTMVFGFYQPGGWRFYYQTWGGFDYTRPATNIKSLVGKRNVQNATDISKHRVIACRYFYP